MPPKMEPAHGLPSSRHFVSLQSLQHAEQRVAPHGSRPTEREQREGAQRPEESPNMWRPASAQLSRRSATETPRRAQGAHLIASLATRRRNRHGRRPLPRRRVEEAWASEPKADCEGAGVWLGCWLGTHRGSKVSNITSVSTANGLLPRDGFNFLNSLIRACSLTPGIL